MIFTIILPKSFCHKTYHKQYALPQPDGAPLKPVLFLQFSHKFRILKESRRSVRRDTFGGICMESPLLLLVEDSAEIMEDNRRALQAQGYETVEARTLGEAKARLAERQPDLILLDVLLPDGNGMDLCREIRELTAAPILFLSSLGESGQVVAGLRAGGDDYIQKPYEMEELLARIEAQLRRGMRLRAMETVACVGGLTLEPSTQRAFLHGRDLLLKPKEFQLLALFLRDREDWRTPEELYREVWGADANADVRTVLVHISNLRSKLREGEGEGELRILRENGKGYRLAVGTEP